MANPDIIPQGREAPKAEAGNDLGGGFAALMELCIGATQGDERAKLALQIFGNMQMAILKNLELQKAEIAEIKAKYTAIVEKEARTETEEPKP